MEPQTSESKIVIDDPTFCDNVSHILDDIKKEDGDLFESDLDDGESVDSDHDTTSELEDTDEDTLTLHNDSRYFYGKNGFKWSKTEPGKRVPSDNIPKLPERRNHETETSEPLELFKKIFTVDIVEDIIKFTNLKLSQVRPNYFNSYRADLKDTELMEMYAFLGLLIYTAVFKSNHEDIRSIFSTDGTGREIFRCTMSKERFSVLLKCLKFDNSLDGGMSKQNDSSAALGNLLTKFISNSQEEYSLGENVTVDEMVIACRFKMKMPSNPEKYDLKLFYLTDARTNYVYNCWLHCKKGSGSTELTTDEKKLSASTQAVVRLCKPIFGSGRNVTCDSRYTSIELATTLLKNGLTLVGDMKKNNKEIPWEFLPSSMKHFGSSNYGFTEEMTLVSFVPKKGKATIILSSMHHERHEEDSGEPEIVSYYNNTKGGVDKLDKGCSTYSSSRRTCRRSLAVFFRILDMSTNNAFVLHKSSKDMKLTDRSTFYKALARQLVEPHVKARMANIHFTKAMRIRIADLLGIEETTPSVDDVGKLPRNRRKLCDICPAKKMRKTSSLCDKCRRPICLEHTKKLCVNCFGQ